MVTYADVLSGRVVPGHRVAVVGAGGIGVDVSHFLTHDPDDDLDDWRAHWGVGDPAVHPGGLTERKPWTAMREVTLVQRKATPIGVGLGKTSGWAHRAVLKQAAVQQVRGASYVRVDDRGLHLLVDGEPLLVEADHVVLCAGQESVREPVRRPGRRRGAGSPDRRCGRGVRARRQARHRAGHPGRGGPPGLTGERTRDPRLPPMRITVIGCGYLGATHAAAMAELGHEVLGIEIDPAKREALTEGRVQIYEPGLSDLLARHVASGRLRFTDSYAEVAGFGDLHFLCVGTPQMAESLAADMRQVEGAIEGLAPT